MGFGWHPIYEMDNKIHAWNHQPVGIYIESKSRIYGHDTHGNLETNHYTGWFFFGIPLFDY